MRGRDRRLTNYEVQLLCERVLTFVVLAFVVTAIIMRE